MKFKVTYATVITKEIDVDIDNLRIKVIQGSNNCLMIEDYLWDEIWSILSNQDPEFIDLYSAESEDEKIYMEH
jgi:hypothetical protein